MRAVWLCGLLLAVTAQAAADGVRTSKDCDSNDRFYFPAEEPDSSVSGIDNFLCNWLSKHLRSMGEPSLQHRAAGKNAHVYRLLVLPGGGQPFVMRLEPLPEGGWRVTEKATDGTGESGGAAGKVIFERTRALTRHEAARARAALTALDLEQTPTEVFLEGYLFAHGSASYVVLEIVRGDRYRIFIRHWHHPAVEPEFRHIFETFDELSDWRLKQWSSAGKK